MYIGNWPSDHARRHPDSVVCIDVASGLSYSWEQFSKECDLIADYLFRLKKINQGDRIAVISQNSYSALSLFFACMQIGAIYVPIDPCWDSSMVASIFGQIRPRLIFADELSNNFSGDLIRFSYKSLLSDSLNLPGSKKHITEVSMSMNDPAVILFTPSNTPIGVTIPQSLIYNNALTTILAEELSRNYCFPAVANFASPAGLFFRLLPTMLIGGSITLFSANVDYSSIIKHCTSHQLYIETKDLNGIEDSLRDRIEIVFPWGGVYSDDLKISEGSRRHTMFPCAGMNCFYKPLGSSSEDILGVPSYGIQTKIGNPLDGAELSDSEAGELFFRGTSLFSGIWNDPTATSDLFFKGWLRTGVMAYHKNGIYYNAFY